MYKVKICGVTDCSCSDIFNKLTPDYVGFILSEGYKRSIDLNRALKIRQSLNSSIICAGVFVDEQIDRVVCAVESGAVQAVQLHGSESAEYIAELKRRTGVTVIKRITNVSDVPQNCDFALLDGTARRGAPAIKIEDVDCKKLKKPCFIAGGLTPENVRARLEAAGAYGADCSGGVEINGAKDGKRIAAFINNVRNGGN